MFDVFITHCTNDRCFSDFYRLFKSLKYPAISCEILYNSFGCKLLGAGDLSVFKLLNFLNTLSSVLLIVDICKNRWEYLSFVCNIDNNGYRDSCIFNFNLISYFTFRYSLFSYTFPKSFWVFLGLFCCGLLFIFVLYKFVILHSSNSDVQKDEIWQQYTRVQKNPGFFISMCSAICYSHKMNV